MTNGLPQKPDVQLEVPVERMQCELTDHQSPSALTQKWNIFARRTIRQKFTIQNIQKMHHHPIDSGKNLLTHADILHGNCHFTQMKNG